MENKDFYIWDPNLGLCTSNPDTVDQTEWFVWDPHVWWEFNRALSQGREFFPKAEINRDPVPPGWQFRNDPRKKVALVFHELIGRPGKEPVLGHSLINDLGLQWADLIVTYTTESLNNWWPVVYGNICQRLHNDKIVCFWSGHPSYTHPPKDFMFVNLRSFFNYVVVANDYQEINEVNTPRRKYMFDALLGTVKTARIFFLYRLLDSGWADHVLVNLQENPHSYDWSLIQDIDPEGYVKHGRIENYSSTGLKELEVPIVQQFKTNTENKSAAEKYSVNLVRIRDRALPGNGTPMSVIVPWHIYQCSWYSIVFETHDLGQGIDFLTEKTAKCLFAKRIFLMFNGAGLLAALRELGFKTFHGKYIDESYDAEPDNALRFAMAWEQTQRLYRTDPREVYAHYRDVLEHNHNLIVSMSSQQLVDAQNFISQHLR